MGRNTPLVVLQSIVSFIILIIIIRRYKPTKCLLGDSHYQELSEPCQNEDDTSAYTHTHRVGHLATCQQRNEGEKEENKDENEVEEQCHLYGS